MAATKVRDCEWREGVASGDIVEVFACGTAAVVTPIGVLKGRDFVDQQPVGSLALELRRRVPVARGVAIALGLDGDGRSL